MSKSTKIVFIFKSTNTKILEGDVNKVKTLIEKCGDVVTGPVCFKNQRQITAYLTTHNTFNRLMEFKPHKSIDIRVLLKS